MLSCTENTGLKKPRLEGAVEVRRSTAIRGARVQSGKAGKAGAVPQGIGIRVAIDGLDLCWAQPLSVRSGIRRRCGERDKQNGSCKREERCGTNESHDDLLGSRSRFIRTSARVDRRVPEVIPWIAMSNYFEALVFVHAFAPDIFSYRSIGFADVGAIAVISRALLCMHFEILLDLIVDEYEPARS